MASTSTPVGTGIGDKQKKKIENNFVGYLSGVCDNQKWFDDNIGNVYSNIRLDQTSKVSNSANLLHLYVLCMVSVIHSHLL